MFACGSFSVSLNKSHGRGRLRFLWWRYTFRCATLEQVSAEDDAALAAYPLVDPWAVKAAAAAKGAVGLPVGVQVAALPHHDELCLRVMKEVELAAPCALSGGDALEAP